MSKFPEKLREGDMVEIVLKTKVGRIRSAVNGAPIIETEYNTFTRGQDDVVSVKILPPPIKAGDMVASKGMAGNAAGQLAAYTTWLKKGEVLAVTDTQAWVKPIQFGGGQGLAIPQKNMTYLLSELEHYE